MITNSVLNILHIWQLSTYIFHLAIFTVTHEERTRETRERQEICGKNCNAQEFWCLIHAHKYNFISSGPLEISFHHDFECQVGLSSLTRVVTETAVGWLYFNSGRHSASIDFGVSELLLHEWWLDMETADRIIKGKMTDRAVYFYQYLHIQEWLGMLVKNSGMRLL